MVAVDEREEALLQPAATPPRTFGPSGQSGFDGVGAAATRVSSKEVGEREAVVDPQVFGLPQRALDLVHRLFGGEIEDRARNGRDRNPALDGGLVTG